MAHLGRASVEGELGVLGSLETGMGDKPRTATAQKANCQHDQLLTDP
jgi:fructose-bisphosphate aldolase class II